MPLVRNLLAQRHFAALLCAAALLLKLVVPTGYMVASVEGRITVEICSGVAIAPTTMAMPAGIMPDAMSAMHGDGSDHASPPRHGEQPDHGKPEMPCAFAGLSAAALGGVDAIQLAAHIVYVMTVGAVDTRLLPLLAPAHLRPPLRGPPAIF